jgi:hypothetical protein
MNIIKKKREQNLISTRQLTLEKMSRGDKNENI